jgi:sec-independent protein translocase protein TatA
VGLNDRVTGCVVAWPWEDSLSTPDSPKFARNARLDAAALSRGVLHLSSHEKGAEMPGATEWLIILGIVLLVFGGKKLPELARSLGKSSREFKKGMAEGESDTESPAERPADKKDA